MNKLDHFYDYEKEFVSIWQGLGKEVLEKNLGAIPLDKRKKNLRSLGWVTISNADPFSRGPHGFRISGLMQEKMVYAGHLDCCQKSNEIIEHLMVVQVSASQLYQVTDVYGSQIGERTEVGEHTWTPVKKEELIYVEADGGMI